MSAAGRLVAGSGSLAVAAATLAAALDALSAELLVVVDQTVAPTRASLWLRPPANPRLPQ